MLFNRLDLKCSISTEESQDLKLQKELPTLTTTKLSTFVMNGFMMLSLPSQIGDQLNKSPQLEVTSTSKLTQCPQSQMPITPCSLDSNKTLYLNLFKKLKIKLAYIQLTPVVKSSVFV